MVNAFHYLRGGVERTCFDETRWLGSAGHEVGHFAIRHAENLPSPTAALFAPPADYGESTPAWRQLGQLPRAVWSAPAAQAMERLIQSFRPDVAHVHAPSRYLTPSVLRPLERARVPLVMTLHDFKPWCTNRLMFAHGAPCERCHGGAHWHAVATGCVQGSRLKSAVGAIEAYVHDAAGAYRAVRRWIAPSRFALEKSAAWGAPRDRLRLLPHAVEPPAEAGHAAAPLEGRYVLYAGRLSLEKGVGLLPALAASLGGVPLAVAGDGPLSAMLESAAASLPSLRLLGRMDGAAFAALRARAAAVVVPSLFYETYGYAMAEALLDARPVIASRIGALPELIEHEQHGLLVAPGDLAALTAAVRRALEDPAAARWGEAGRARARAACVPADHVRGLLALYDEARAA
jgi:glycosyltransferase involved in cell wall biosynthesis